MVRVASEFIREWPRQLRRLRLFILVAFLPALAVLAIAALQTQVPLVTLMRDPAAAAGTPSYFGMISQLGAILWSSAAAVCLFSWLLARRWEGGGEWRSFFLFFGGFSAVLLLDDMFLIHDQMVPENLHVSDNAVYLLYACTALLFLWKLNPVIRRTNHVLLFISLGFLGASTGVDVVERLLPVLHDPVSVPYRIFAEDGAKLVGIVGWLAYLVDACRSGINIGISKDRRLILASHVQDGGRIQEAALDARHPEQN